MHSTIEQRTDRHIGLLTVTDGRDRRRFVLTVALSPAQNPGHHQTIEHGPIPAGALNLSMTGEIVNLRYRRSSPSFDEAGGQVGEYLREMAADPAAIFDAGVTRETCEAIADLWQRWHLNEMRAGCAHQEPVYEADRYGHAWLFEELPAAVLAWALEAIATGTVSGVPR